MAALLVAGLSGPVTAPAAAATAPKTPETAVPSPPTISHAPLRCVQAQEFPRVAAGIESAATLKRTRVYFKAHQHPDWYFVDMRRLATPQYLALLPQPLPETKQVDYYVQALDEQVQTAQTDTFDPEVSRGPCAIKPPKGWKGREEITIGGTKEGQPPIPPGFSRKGIVGFLAVSGALIAGSALSGGGSAGTTVAGAATGSGSASAGGGSSTLLMVGGGAAAAAAGVGVAFATRGSESGPLEIRRTVEGVALTHVTEIGFSLANAETLSSITWSFGDGERAGGPTASHVYETEGTFTVTATANEGGGGTRSATTTVQTRALTGTWHDQASPGREAEMDLVQDGQMARGQIRTPQIVFEVSATLYHPREVVLTIRHPGCPTLDQPTITKLRDTVALLNVEFHDTCSSYGWSIWDFVR